MTVPFPNPSFHERVQRKAQELMNDPEFRSAAEQLKKEGREIFQDDVFRVAAKLVQEEVESEAQQAKAQEASPMEKLGRGFQRGAAEGINDLAGLVSPKGAKQREALWEEEAKEKPESPVGKLLGRVAYEGATAYVGGPVLGKLPGLQWAGRYGNKLIKMGEAVKSPISKAIYTGAGRAFPFVPVDALLGYASEGPSGAISYPAADIVGSTALAALSGAAARKLGKYLPDLQGKPDLATPEDLGTLFQEKYPTPEDLGLTAQAPKQSKVQLEVIPKKPGAKKALKVAAEEVATPEGAERKLVVTPKLSKKQLAEAEKALAEGGGPTEARPFTKRQRKSSRSLPKSRKGSKEK